MKHKLIEVDGSQVEEKYHVSPLVAKVLAYSTLSEEEIRDILESDSVLSTSKATCVLAARDEILKARAQHQKVFIGGDYDADGITSTAIMKDVLDRLGIENGYYIPDRFREGYGLSKNTVERVHEKGYSVILTVDNGVKAHEALRRAHELGMKTIVTDHHQIEEEVEADILVHPSLMEPEFAFLSGAGVALQLARSLDFDEPLHIALAAVAAIADVMPYYRETRKIIKCGFEALRNGACRPLSALLRPGVELDEKAVSFQIVPRLNSVGRMNDVSNVNTLVPFLLLKNDKVIQDYASQLNKVNQTRKTLSATMVEQAESMLTQDDFQILFDPSFHEGICGLAAGKIANQIHKPTLVLAGHGECIKGSGRSVPGFNMFEFFKDFDELEAFGGHEQAVGLSMKAEDLKSFRMHVQEKMKQIRFNYEESVPTAIRVDADDLCFEQVLDLECLAPVPKNLNPILFAVMDPEIVNVFKSPRVTKYSFKNRSGGFEGVLFPWNSTVEVVDEIHCVLGNVHLNRFRNKVTVQMELEEIVGF